MPLIREKHDEKMFVPGTMNVLFTQQGGNEVKKEIRIFIQLMLSDMKYTWSQFIAFH